MVEIMKQYNEQRKKLEKIFSDLKMKYEYQEFEDDDLNYFITFDAPDGRLKRLKSIDGILYLSSEMCMLNLLILNIYRFKESDDFGTFYKIINLVNSKLTYGSFYIHQQDDDMAQIIYRSSTHCGNEFLILDEQLIKSIIVNFVIGLDELFNTIFKEKSE